MSRVVVPWLCPSLSIMLPMHESSIEVVMVVACLIGLGRTIGEWEDGPLLGGRITSLIGTQKPGLAVPIALESNSVMPFVDTVVDVACPCNRSHKRWKNSFRDPYFGLPSSDFLDPYDGLSSSLAACTSLEMKSCDN
jgi:hypothetical protein